MTTDTALLDLLPQLEKARVLCVGDIMLDRFVYGSVDRISPEAPIPIIRIERESTMLGGAGNVVRNIASLSAQAHFCGIVGHDDQANEVENLLLAQKGCAASLIQDSGRTTSIKTRYLAAGQQMMRADKETISALSEDLRAKLINKVTEILPTVDVLVLSDYGKGVLANGTAADLIALARKAGKPVIVDPKGSDYSIYKGASLITPNRKELTEASRMPTDSDEAIVRAAHHLIESCGVENVLATRSQDGMTLVAKDHHVTHLPTEAQEVFDVSGAGDTVVAALAMAISVGAELALAAQLANIAAGIVVGKVGTAAVYGDELFAAIHHRDITTAEAKVLGLESAADRVANWKSRGLKVGFTNGCFDLLHPGHVSLLNQSKSQCDRLIVGLNSDSSVKRLKGEERPVQNEAARSTVLSSLSCVDMVVIFNEDTPLHLINTLLPDVLVKGADYRVDQVVGADVVQANGGRVFLADLKQGFSTTNTVKKLKGSL